MKPPILDAANPPPILSNCQHGFRKSRSTVINLMEFTSFINDGFKERKKTDVVYTNFSKAFDKANHKLLLRKLEFMDFITSYIFVFIVSSKRVLKCLSIEEKYKLIKEVDGGLKKKEAAAKYGIPASTVSTIFKNKESIITSFESGFRLSIKRMKSPKFYNSKSPHFIVNDFMDIHTISTHLHHSTLAPHFRRYQPLQHPLPYRHGLIITEIQIIFGYGPMS
ncbi:uncharacterized protein LOC142235666 [Haematobia irritans]|uniref:uncharacterized protein LOC142235666 n=1 Tax=Haematobia irritans TaxID=7368 RepID=UPI003F50340F